MANQLRQMPDGRHSWPVIAGLVPADLELLDRLPLFDGLDPTCVAQLLDQAAVALAGRRTVLVRRGQPADCCYVVLDGSVMLHRLGATGHDAVIDLVGSGQSFAEAALFDDAVFPMTATVITDARLLVVTAGRFIHRLRDHPPLSLNILASLSRQLHRRVEQIEQRCASTSTERLAGFLLRLCPDGARSIEVELPLDQQYIAGALGMPGATFSRSLARLRALGVTCHGSRVAIDDIAALHRFCDREVSRRDARGATGP